tara:strand:- start:69 stop:590 length:522 start_codon:yes stop_codon:yes gene_type:complete
MKKNKKKGILFWIEGFSGSGKTQISKNIHKHIVRRYGPTLIIQGDDLRKIFKLYNYSKEGRYSNFLKFSKFVKFITNQNINIIFTVVGMIKAQRQWLRKNIINYVEIHIKSKINKIKKINKKKLYKKKINIVGIDIKPEYPTNADIVINNNFKKNIRFLSNQLIKKIDNIKLK